MVEFALSKIILVRLETEMRIYVQRIRRRTTDVEPHACFKDYYIFVKNVNVSFSTTAQKMLSVCGCAHNFVCTSVHLCVHAVGSPFHAGVAGLTPSGMPVQILIYKQGNPRQV